jgi:hypothetical protein
MQILIKTLKTKSKFIFFDMFDDWKISSNKFIFELQLYRINWHFNSKSKVEITTNLNNLETHNYCSMICKQTLGYMASVAEPQGAEWSRIIWSEPQPEH